MRVLYSFNNALGEPCSPGITAWHHVVNLARIGATVTIICPINLREFPTDSKITLVETQRFAGTRLPFRVISRLFPRGSAERLHDRRVASFLTRSSNAFDVVHCWPLAAEKTLATAKRRGIPSFLERSNAHTAVAWDVVEKVHADLGIPMDPSDTHVRDSAHLAREEREYALADQILCPSKFVRDSFIDRKFPVEKLTLTGRGYDPAKFHAEGRPINPKGPLTACFIGNEGPRKGLHHALKAWLDSGNADAGGKFFVAGRIPQSYLEFLAPLLHHNSIEILGYESDPTDLMRSCDVFILPSAEEASAKVTYEAKACGSVLLVSDSSCDHVRDGLDGFVHQTGDVAQLTRHLRTLGEDRALLERMRAASLESAKSLSWHDAAAVLIAAYESGIARGRELSP